MSPKEAAPKEPPEPIHIDHNNCLEVIILKGKSNRIKEITNKLSAERGIKHGKLIMTSTGRDLY